MQAVDRVRGVHHVHVWQLDENNILLESHVLIDENDMNQMEAIKASLKKLLSSRFNIHHSTLEFEFEPCEEPAESPCN
jgi:cobalt-zinc-cadmium efflux system protein